LRTRLLKIINRAGVKPWPKLFHNLRASCETDLAKIHPIKAVCDWIGNSITVAQRHYLQTTEEDFERASGIENPTQQPSVRPRRDSQTKHPARKTPGKPVFYLAGEWAIQASIHSLEMTWETWSGIQSRQF